LENVLSIQNLTKHYGRIRAVDNLSLDIPSKSVYGILGPNGSGKTTTLGIILDVILPSRGEYYWFGKPSSDETRRQIGSILEAPLFYPYLSARQNLQLVADIRKVPHIQIPAVLERVGLQERSQDAFSGYSLGMKQRLAIAAALLGSPRVLILDEHTNGLDPQGIAEVRNLITQIAREGITILLASHLLDEVQKVCTHVAVLKAGKKLFAGHVTEVLAGITTIEVAAEDMERLAAIVQHFPNVRSIRREGDKLLVSLPEGSNSIQLNQYLVSQGVVLSHLLTQQQSLEKQFLSLLAQS
jgi:ABC-type multidrug transport system ATPase subunit